MNECDVVFQLSEIIKVLWFFGILISAALWIR